MNSTGDDGFDADDLDPDAVLWVRGVNYVAGWRDATQALTELTDALTMAGIDTTGAQLRANASADGSGMLRLELTPETAREIAMLARVTATKLRNAG
ncbi:hypothetical protein GCM10011583_51250 [Streptomyces camponoticapitis]|uniref:Uncharacterized protein n=1 Tax=Streptomyces camponoticapitis TaxID=1616125 RepID=A0ABQ2EIP1_9ACTN|nr:hypothetical protein [Streptomyces camponoticapitis]GGK13040.1 hypothetical protein GCM10011583_51250 [Streptomyces camponoticapitis]